ncbi:putative threonine efflux protein [Mesorhizobium sp. ORS 3324]|nr:putative threonine efflux protein [Mesorhizobium sp. ORS 3324]
MPRNHYRSPGSLFCMDLDMPELDLLTLLGGLLLTPGPTNLLLAVCAVSSALRGAASMLASVVLAYLLVMAGVAALVALVPADSQSAVRAAMKICAILWLLWLAYSVWTASGDGVDQQLVTTRQVFVTTLVNPKATIVALLAQSHGMSSGLLIAIAALVWLSGAAWIIIGFTVRRSGSGLFSKRALRRLSAICLAGFGVLLAGASL